MLIRRATAADRAAISDLHAASWRDSYRAELSEAELRDVLPGAMEAKWAARSFAPPELTLLAEADGVVTGFACARAGRDPALIDNLHVRPGLRGGGVGAALLAALKTALAQQGIAAATLTVLQSNPRALAFYRAHGGTDEGAVEDRLLGRPVRARRVGFALG